MPTDAVAIEKWMKQQVDHLSGASIARAIEAALAVAGAAYANKACLVPGLQFALLRLLNQDPTASHAAAWALVWLSGGWAPELSRHQRLWQPTPDEADHLVGCLTTMGDPEALRFLARVAVNARLSDAVAPLISLVHHPSYGTREAAIQALGGLGDSRAFEPLLACVRDVNIRIRGASLEALGQLGDSRAFEPLLASLRDEEKTIRQAAFGALGRLRGDDTDRNLLSQFLNGSAPWLDPKERITDARVAEATHRLKLSAPEVRKRYEKLATDFGLQLASD